MSLTQLQQGWLDGAAGQRTSPHSVGNAVCRICRISGRHNFNLSGHLLSPLTKQVLTVANQRSWSCEGALARARGAQLSPSRHQRSAITCYSSAPSQVTNAEVSQAVADMLNEVRAAGTPTADASAGSSSPVSTAMQSHVPYMFA